MSKFVRIVFNDTFGRIVVCGLMPYQIMAWCLVLAASGRA